MKEAPEHRPVVCLLREPSAPDPYARALEEAGYRSVFVPVLAFSFVNRAALRQALRRPEASGGLILTSPRAVEALAEALRGTPEALARWTSKRVFVVGPRTEADARALGFSPAGAAAGEASALADLIAQAPPGLPLLFLCGNLRREVLPQRLREAGVPFRELVVYETRRRRAFELDADEAPAWIVFFSPSGVEAVREAEGGAPGAVRRAAFGPTTAEALAAAGWPADAVAAEPTPEALVEALRAAGGSEGPLRET